MAYSREGSPNLDQNNDESFSNIASTITPSLAQVDSTAFILGKVQIQFRNPANDVRIRRSIGSTTRNGTTGGRHN